MIKLRMLVVFTILASLIPQAYARKTRIAKIKHKVPADTIFIPETVFADELPSDTITPIFLEVGLEETCNLPVAAASKVMLTDSIDGSLTILGEALADEEMVINYIITRNPDFNPDIARAFLEVGKIYGIRGDVALCQSIIETGWFLFTGGTAVTLDQNNFCGLGVTKKGLKGHSFSNVKEGVTAQIQHLYAYATNDRLPEGEKMIDPRFSLVPRGVATSWNDLNNRWAANNRYGESIIRVFKEMLNSANSERK